MIPTSYPQSNNLVPIRRMSVGDSGAKPVSLNDRFKDSSNSIYSRFSPYGGGNDGGISIGYQQPYVWTSLNDSKTKKYLKRYDNTTFPEGSTIQDLQRIGKFTLSGTGAIFSGIQFALQNQNAFNETRIWNPTSILVATSRKGLFGLVDRPTRHIESSGGGIFSTILDGFLSSVGIQSKAISGKTAPSGTATMGLEALSLEAKTGKGWAAKGLVRYQTAVSGQDNFVAKFSSNGKNQQGQSVVSGFLKSLGNSIISKVTSLIPNTKGYQADWKYRPEYSDKIGVYEAFRLDRSHLLSYKVVGTNYNASDVHRWIGIVDGSKDGWYYGPSKKANDSFISPIVGLTTQLESGKYDATKDINGKTYGNPPDKTGLVTYTSVDKVIGDAQVLRITTAVQEWNLLNESYDKIDANFYKKNFRTYKDLRTLKLREYENNVKANRVGETLEGEKGKQFPGANKADKYNELLPIVEKFVGDGPPEELKGYGGQGSRDIIFFYFLDVVNNVYVPFRATITGLNESNSVEWEDFQYIGRADKLYMYKGFTREINFAFSVYANSVSELEPMWRRINYLSGLTRPSKYTTDKTGTDLGEFIYPPMMKFRIGDLYVDQPAVIRQFGFSIPDDAPWETLSARTSYSYNLGRITGKKNVAQLPMKVDMTISLALLEKERSATQSIRYFDNSMTGFKDAGVPVTSTRDKNKERRDAENLAYANKAFASTPTFSTTTDDLSLSKQAVDEENRLGGSSLSLSNPGSSGAGTVAPKDSFSSFNTTPNSLPDFSSPPRG